MEVFFGKKSVSAFVVVSVLMGAETAYAGGIGERYLAVDAGTTENSDNTNLYYCDCGSGDYLAERADRAVGVRAGYRHLFIHKSEKPLKNNNLVFLLSF